MESLNHVDEILRLIEVIYDAAMSEEGEPILLGILAATYQAPSPLRQPLQLLLPHLSRATQIRQQLAHAFHKQALALVALNELRIGVVLLDASAQPVFLNHEAEILLPAAGWQVGEAGLVHRRLVDTQRLRALILAAVHTGCKTDGEMCCMVGNKRLLLRIVPLPHPCLTADMHVPGACVAIFASQTGQLRLPWKRIAAYYSLSPAEAKLAVILAEGESVEDAAEKLGISVHTARTQLKSIFAKTDVRRQSELVSMLLQGALALCREDAVEPRGNRPSTVLSSKSVHSEIRIKRFS